MTEQKKTKDYFFEIQGTTTFCRVKNDWIEFDRIHLSFVKHDGAKPKPKKLVSIEGALKLHGADGALSLCSMIASGEIARRAARSKEQANGSYPEAVFISMGGTPTTRSRDGKAEFRQFLVSPGNKSDYIFIMSKCEGEDTPLGGIAPKKGAQRTNIVVSLSSGDIKDFAQSILAEYTAYRTRMCLAGQVLPNEECADISKADAKIFPGDKITRSSNLFAIFYDTGAFYKDGTPRLFSIESAEKGLQEITRFLLSQEGRYIADKADYADCINMIKQEKENQTIINFKEKNGSQTCQVIVILTKAN